MKVCDRHTDRPATDTIVIYRDDERIDVCAECKTDLLAFLHSKPPPKDKALKNLAKAN